MAIRAGWPMNREKRSAGNPSRFLNLFEETSKRHTNDCRRRAFTFRTSEMCPRIRYRRPRLVHRFRFARAIARDLLSLAHLRAPEPDWPRWKSRRHPKFDARSDGDWSAGVRHRARR